MTFQAFTKTITAALCGAALATAVSAQEDAVLTVTAGDMEHTYTMEQLKELPSSSFETETIWTEGAQTFQGVSLKDLMDTLDVSEGMIEATAINDYAVEIPMEDAVSDGPIIAYANNAKEMSRRGKGPLWIVYPYDSDVKYQTETIYSRSIWQLNRLAIK